MSLLTEDAPAGLGVALSDADIHARIVSAILDHRLAPGTKLGEDKLGTAFGVSRTRIRPVLVRLASEQIVTLTPNRGAHVAQPTEQESREVFETRRLIEPTLLARCMAGAGAADLARLQDCIREEEAARQRGDHHRAIRLAGDFHLHIADAAGHGTLSRILRELVSRTSLVLMAWGPAPAAMAALNGAAGCGCHEHRALLAAIRLRDAEAGARLMNEHLSHLEARLDFRPPAVSQDLADLLGPGTGRA